MNNFSVKFVILFVVQIILSNVLDFFPLLVFCFLPSLILFLPIRYSSARTMLIAFILGLILDFMSGAQLGLCSASLVLVGLLRRSIVSLVFGSETLSRNEDISIYKQRLGQINIAIVIVTGLFFLVYIVLESAGTRLWWIDMIRWASSVIVSSLVGLFVARILGFERNLKWK